MSDKDARDTANPGSEGGDHRATILLVDDDNDVREVTAILLNDLGYAVIEAESGQAVLAQLERDDGRSSDGGFCDARDVRSGSGNQGKGQVACAEGSFCHRLRRRSAHE